MNARVNTSELQALPSTTGVPTVLFLTEKSQSQVATTRTGMNQDDEQLIALRATKMTDVLKKILERPCYTHGGLND
jgi:hypothetical protein